MEFLENMLPTLCNMIALFGFFVSLNKEKKKDTATDSSRMTKLENNIEVIKEAMLEMKKEQAKTNASLSDCAERVCKLEVKVEMLERRSI